MSTDDKKKAPAKKMPNKLGHDPLAWINEDDPKAEADAVELPVVTVAKSTPAPIATKASSSASKILNLPMYFGIGQSSEVCSDMQKILSSDCSAVQIAGGDVESCDTAAIQLILAFNKQAKTLGKDVEWLACSQKISDIGGLLGVKL